MAEIFKHITFSKSEVELIKSKVNDPAFSFLNWSDVDLMPLRSSIRTYYKTVQKGECAYCKNSVSLSSASNCHVEHIVPKSIYSNFIFEPKNLCVICADCNTIKRQQETLGEVIDTLKKGGGRKLYPRSSNAFKIVHPHFDNYDDHILKLNHLYYLDKSPKGNFTIYACKLNRNLYVFGWEREIVDESKLMELMNHFINETSFTKRMRVLTDLKKLLLLI